MSLIWEAYIVVTWTRGGGSAGSTSHKPARGRGFSASCRSLGMHKIKDSVIGRYLALSNIGSTCRVLLLQFRQCSSNCQCSARADLRLRSWWNKLQALLENDPYVVIFTPPRIPILCFVVLLFDGNKKFLWLCYFTERKLHTEHVKCPNYTPFPHFFVSVFQTIRILWTISYKLISIPQIPWTYLGSA
jgi:hypothetical protein